MDTDVNKAQEHDKTSEQDAEKPKGLKSRTASKAAKPSKSKSTGRGKQKARQADEARRPRTVRPFPAASFEDSLTIALAMQQLGGDKRVRRITVFEHLKKSPDSGRSRQMITNSNAYGVTSGGYQADYVELTDDGMIATDPEAATGEQFKSRLKLAIQNIEHFGLLYEKYAGSKLPANAVLRDHLREHGVEDEWLDECVALFIVNCKFVGVLRDIAGAERLLKADHALEETVKGTHPKDETRIAAPHISTATATDWDKKCFYITPIGEEGSEERKHADLFMASLIQPAIEL